MCNELLEQLFNGVEKNVAHTKRRDIVKLKKTQCVKYGIDATMENCAYCSYASDCLSAVLLKWEETESDIDGM